MLDHRPATTTWWLASAFRRRFPQVRLDVTRPLIVDGGLLCAGSVFAMADLALAVVTRAAGPSLARSCGQVLLLDEHPSQAPYMALEHLRTDEPMVRAAEEWVRVHLARPFGIAELARGVGASPRTLARRFDTALGITPSGFVQGLRLQAARQLLETSALPLDQVAAQVGYADAGTLTVPVAPPTRPYPARPALTPAAPRVNAGAGMHGRRAPAADGVAAHAGHGVVEGRAGGGRVRRRPRCRR